MIARLLVLAVTLTLAGCDLASLMADPKAAQREADAKAIGSACRYGLRSLEDCFAMNEKASKAAVFAGWKEMDQYMRDNKVDSVDNKGSTAAENKDAGGEKAAGEAKGEGKTESADAKGEGKEPKTKPKAKSKAADKAPA